MENENIMDSTYSREAESHFADISVWTQQIEH
jgi:hypothetical protein